MLIQAFILKNFIKITCLLYLIGDIIGSNGITNGPMSRVIFHQPIRDNPIYPLGIKIKDVGIHGQTVVSIFIFLNVRDSIELIYLSEVKFRKCCRFFFFFG